MSVPAVDGSRPASVADKCLVPFYAGVVPVVAASLS